VTGPDVAVPRIDAHAHIMPPDYRAELERRELMTVPLPPWSPELLDGLLDRHAIDAAVLSLSPPGVFFGDQGLADELARLVNERTAEHVRSAPERFAGLAVLPLPDVDRALAELRHGLDDLGLDGVTLLSNVAGTYLGDPAWDPLFDELDRRRAYVFVHPNAAPGAPPLPEHPIWLYEYPFDTTRAIANLVYSGTLERCPRIRLQVSHLGGAAPFLAHRLASLEAREPDRATRAPAGALAYLSRLYYDTGLSNHALAVRPTLELAEAGRVVFGTDWPYADLPADGDPAPDLDGLGDGIRAGIDAANAVALVPRLAAGWGLSA
jgi:predicted TIM-barrel fold metal-dependent hydrolase